MPTLTRESLRTLLSDPASPASQSFGGRSFDLGGVAAAGATALVAISAVLYPTFPSGLAAWVDGVINEWLVWFTGLYVSLVIVIDVREKLRRW